jgi:CheY-like chemotaxis protein
MKSAFLANMSHEIRTPMNGILGFTELLKSQDYSIDEQKHFINIIQQSGDRMLSTINNIIEISKIESGVETLQINKINVERIILELFQFFNPEATRRGIELILEKNEYTLNSDFYSDNYKLNSILTNLIKNALKFTQAGSVKIGYSITDEIARFYVSDTGIGIQEEKQKAIFDYFIQADTSHSSRFEGSGLGLSISSQYTKMLNGKIWVESEINKGSTFFVNIPNQNQLTDSNQETGKDEKAVNPVHKSDLKILIAEDDITSFYFLKYILEKITSNILHAENGLKAVELMKNNPDTDIILMDSKMPELNGLEAVKQIRKFNPDVFIISQTAYAQNGYRAKSMEAGCNEYIEKPVNKNKLYDIITKHSKLN